MLEIEPGHNFCQLTKRFSVLVSVLLFVSAVAGSLLLLIFSAIVDEPVMALWVVILTAALCAVGFYAVYLDSNPDKRPLSKKQVWSVAGTLFVLGGYFLLQEHSTQIAGFITGNKPSVVAFVSIVGMLASILLLAGIVKKLRVYAHICPVARKPE